MSNKRNPERERWSDIDGGSAFVIPYTLLRHVNYRRLSPYGHKLLADLACQYTGFNNGYLCASWTLMKDCGWKSVHTLRTAILECEHYGLLIRTQQGGRNKPNLHGFSWRRIDKKTAQPLEHAPTLKPTDEWKNSRPAFERVSGSRKSRRPRTHKTMAARN